jgi:acyl-CoA synthetase (AMP-forming)/AMP-acid ligase II
MNNGNIRSSPPATLQVALERAAHLFADRGLAIFDGRGRTGDFRTYRELFELACTGAARLSAHGVREGEPVLVALPTSWSWVEAWFGVLVLGGLPVAISVPGRMAADDAHLSKMEAVIESVGARHIVAGAALREQAGKGGYRRVFHGVVTPEELAARTVTGVVKPHIAEPSEIAFLQLTSGSTGLPRAVMISHRAAIHNPLASCEAIGAPSGAPAQAWADCFDADFEVGGDCRWSNGSLSGWTADCDGDGFVSDESRTICSAEMPMQLPSECLDGEWVQATATCGAFDCNDDRPDVFLGQPMWQIYGYGAGGPTTLFDFNCDGVEEQRYTTFASNVCCSWNGESCVAVSLPTCDPPGWDADTVSEVPGCGETAKYWWCEEYLPGFCTDKIAIINQLCR